VPGRLATALSDRYRIERELGQGGMATVYLAEDLRHHRQVALKVIRSDFAEGMGSQRFLREIRLAASLHHPNILPLYDSGEAGGELYYVMPVAEGESLRGRLQRERSLPVGDAVRLACEVADALDYAHRHGVVHRDIKPENILLHEGHALVTDFGIGKALSTASAATTLTQTGLAIGTPAYMSPEQAGGEPNLDGRSDLYSLGCVLYEMLAGVPPFTGATVGALIAKRFTEAAPDVRTVRVDVPQSLSEVTRRCLARDPDGRYATGAQLTSALGKLTGTGSPETKSVDSGAERARSRLPWIAVSSFTSRDPSLAELVEGLAEDITTGLSRFSHLQVVARQSVTNLSAGTDVRRVGEAVGARYVIEGNLRKSGSTVRLSVQLVDAQTGTHLWAETFDRDLGAASIFALQDELTDRIVATVADPFGVLVRVMAHPLLEKPVEELTASELCIRLYAHNQHLGPEEHARIRRGLELALTREPNHAEAWANLATMYWGEKMHGLNPLPDSMGRARKAADRAVQIDSASQMAWEAVAEVQYFSGDLAGFRQSAERAMALNPRNTSTVAVMAMLIAYGGEWERGYQLVQRAMALNPHHAGWFHFVSVNYHIKKGDYESALAAIKRVNMPEFPWTYTNTAVICAALGRWEEARQAADSLRKLFPAIALNAGRHTTAWFYDKELDIRENELLLKALAVPDSPATPAPSPQSVAVLPFANMSGSPDEEYFSDGISEEIINALTQLPGLRVAARTSAFSFKGKNEDLRSVGEKLGVTTVLEGSVRRAGKRLRITAQLINVSDGYHLWSERYDRENTDIFAIQDEIAGAIAAKLKLALAGGEARPRVRPATANLDAYELLLKGRVFHAQRGASIIRAKEAFEQALLLDPELAEAHALLGDAYRLLAVYGMAPTAEVIPRARGAAERALALDPRQVEALATLASITAIFDWDEAGSNALSDRAVALDPRHVRSIVERAFINSCRRGTSLSIQQEALSQFEAAIRLDPLSAWAAALHSFGLASVGHQAEAVAEANRAIELDPAAFTGRWALVWALGAGGRDAEALEAAEPALMMSGRGSRVLADAAAAHARLGHRDAAEQIYQEITSRARSGYVGWSEQGAIAASAGRMEEARVLVARGIEARDSFLAFLTCPAWGPFHADPASLAMLEGVGP
jgi:eukaryotic-like serine/threonine-protein kinase